MEKCLQSQFDRANWKESNQVCQITRETVLSIFVRTSCPVVLNGNPYSPLISSLRNQDPYFRTGTYRCRSTTVLKPLRWFRYPEDRQKSREGANPPRFIVRLGLDVR